MILIKLLYSDHVAYISFIFLLLFHLRFVMKFILSLRQRFPLSLHAVVKCHNNNADDTVKEENVRRAKEKCHTEVLKQKEEYFSVTELLCCHVDGEKLCVPYFHSRQRAPGGEKLFCHFRHYLLIYHYNRK